MLDLIRIIWRYIGIVELIKAADIISSVLTNTKDARNKLIKRWYSFKKANYAYGNTSNMGKAVHVDVK